MASWRSWDRSAASLDVATWMEAEVDWRALLVAPRLTVAWSYSSSAWSSTVCCWEIWASMVATWDSVALIWSWDGVEPTAVVDVPVAAVVEVVLAAVAEVVVAAPAVAALPATVAVPAPTQRKRPAVHASARRSLPRRALPTPLQGRGRSRLPVCGCPMLTSATMPRYLHHSRSDKGVGVGNGGRCRASTAVERSWWCWFGSIPWSRSGRSHSVCGRGGWSSG